MSPIVCLVTCPSKDVAVSIARQLVDDQFAACVNIIPGAQSVYRWKGEICIDEEVLLLVKSADHMIERLRQRILELHPYEVPEFVVLEPTAVSQKYAEWLGASVLPRA
jgi:periplasmic divalent cation tolerance protein